MDTRHNVPRERKAGWPSIPPRLATTAAFFLVAAIQAALAGAGYLQATGAYSLSLVSPAAGFGVAVTIRYGHRMLPALALGMAVADVLHGNPLPVALWLSVAVVIGAGLGAELVWRFVPRMGRPEADARDLLAVLLLAGILATGATALLGAWGLHVIGGLPAGAIPATVGTWWLGDAVGVITVAPAVLAWLVPLRRREALARPGELAVLVILMVAVLTIAFGMRPPLPAALSDLHAEFLVLPFFVWGALRFGLVGAATTVLLMTAITTAASTLGNGPFGGGTIAEVYGLQFMLALGSGTVLLLGITTSHEGHLHRQAQSEAAFIRSIADNLPGAVYRRHLSADGELSYPYMAGRFAREFGLDDDSLQRPFQATAAAPRGLRHLYAQDFGFLHARLQRSAAELEPLEMELRYVRDDGGIRWVRSISRPRRTEHGGVIWDGILLDVTEEKEQRSRVEYLARHDPLTGLMNRTALRDQLDTALARARRHEHSVALCLLDLDRFKEINDSYGHAAGDALLQVVAERIRETVRLEDIKARLGGDEFMVAQSDVHDHGSVALACRRLAECLQQPFKHDEYILYPGVSIGVALFPADGASEDELFTAADQAMYRAKSGKSGPVFYSPDMGAEIKGRGELARDLAHAIQHRELTLHYQPQIFVPTGETCGVEALVRWQHPERGSISPGEFVPLAEERGLVSALDLLVLELALADAADWQSTPGFGFPVAINLSGVSLRDSEHRDRLAHAIRESSVPVNRLELELTETALVHATDERVADGLRALAALGVHFSADDFGTGYGSLTYLRSLPITRIKIDRSFVQGAPLHQNDAEIVRALLQLARNLGLHVIAEGVETQAELDKLSELGCLHVQGFHFARPMSRKALEEYVAARGVTFVDSLLDTYVV